MAVIAEWYGTGPASGYDWINGNIKAALLDGAYVLDQDNHHFFSDVSAHEVVGAGYAAGGAALAGRTKVYDAPSNTNTLDADDLSWVAASISARFVVVYQDMGNPAMSPLLGFIDLGASQSVASTNFVIAWNALGILTAQAV